MKTLTIMIGSWRIRPEGGERLIEEETPSRVSPGQHHQRPLGEAKLGERLMSDAQIHAKAVIAAAIIQSRGVDIEGLASANKDVSNRKVAHLQELTERIYHALTTERAS